MFIPRLSELDGPAEVLERNRRAIVVSSVVLGVLDGAGEGVFYELGLADGLGKRIALYCQGDWKPGKMLAARWAELDPDFVAKDIEQAVAAVTAALSRISSGGSQDG